MPTADQVLATAYAIIEMDALDDPQHGAFCPFCAIAKAKGILDRAEGHVPSFLDLLLDIRFDDLPLVEARNRLRVETMPATKEEVLAVLKCAIEG